MFFSNPTVIRQLERYLLSFFTVYTPTLTSNNRCWFQPSVAEEKNVFRCRLLVMRSSQENLSGFIANWRQNLIVATKTERAALRKIFCQCISEGDRHLRHSPNCDSCLVFLDDDDSPPVKGSLKKPLRSPSLTSQATAVPPPQKNYVVPGLSGEFESQCRQVQFSFQPSPKEEVSEGGPSGEAVSSGGAVRGG